MNVALWNCESPGQLVLADGHVVGIKLRAAAYGGAVAGSLNSTEVISPDCEFTTMSELVLA